MKGYKEFTIWGECLEELEIAVDRVDGYMKRTIGRNIIRYQIIGADERQPWDSGFISDKAVKELEKGFIIIQDTPHRLQKGTA